MLIEFISWAINWKICMIKTQLCTGMKLFLFLLKEILHYAHSCMESNREDDDDEKKKLARDSEQVEGNDLFHFVLLLLFPLIYAVPISTIIFFFCRKSIEIYFIYRCRCCYATCYRSPLPTAPNIMR